MAAIDDLARDYTAMLWLGLFAPSLDLLITDPASGHAQPFTEIAIFTVRDGRFIEERFFYE